MVCDPLAVPPPQIGVCVDQRLTSLRDPWRGQPDSGLSNAISQVSPDFLAQNPRSQCNHSHQGFLRCPHTSHALWLRGAPIGQDGIRWKGGQDWGQGHQGGASVKEESV